jgi:hypothetical protein
MAHDLQHHPGWYSMYGILCRKLPDRDIWEVIPDGTIYRKFPLIHLMHLVTHWLLLDLHITHNMPLYSQSAQSRACGLILAVPLDC